MMGLPGIEPHFVSEQIKHDPLVDHIRDQLEFVVDTTQEALQKTLDEVKIVLADPNATLEQRQLVADKLQRLTQGAKHATQSVKDFQQGELFEKKVIDTALDEGNSPEEVIHKGERWMNEAANYLNKSKEGLVKASESVAPEIAQTDPETQKNFFQRVASAVLGIEAMVQRVNALPERLAEQIISGTEKRIDAVNKTFRQWASQTQHTYYQLRQDLQQEVENVVDHSVALGQTVMGRIEATDAKLGIMVQENVINPILNFITTKAIPGFKAVSKSLFDGLSEQVRQTSSDYQNTLQKRREGRANAATIEAPEVETASKMSV